jgi:hypothetical protein
MTEEVLAIHSNAKSIPRNIDTGYWAQIQTQTAKMQLAFPRECQDLPEGRETKFL